ncbi:MAG: TonB-dependent receptor [Bacteroidetes bacterium]|jgi:outer membrane receptor protein involved in Fe transport|nr:TonB-dependent receptor [Bacteroidota bacterium]
MRNIVLVLCGILAATTLALAGTTGKLAGRLVDRQTGEAVMSANVMIRSLIRGASSDVEGYYHIIELPPGQYEVTVSCVGYRPEQHRVTIKVDMTTTLNLSLVPEAVEVQEVVVSAERPVVQRDQVSTIQKATAEELQTLPVSTISGVLQLQTGVVNTGSLHIRGGRAGEVGYYVDGYRVEDPLFNSEVLEINNHAIQEMELLSGTFNAEYGNALSGIVNVVTKETFASPRANLIYRRTNLGLEPASDHLNERSIEGTVSGALWEGSPVAVMVSGRKVDADSYYFSGVVRSVTDTTGRTRRESVDFSRDKPFGFNDYFAGVAKVSWAPFGGAKVTLLDNYSRRRWQSYDHIMRFIPDSTYLRRSESNLLGLNFRHALSNDLFYDLRLSHYTYRYFRSVNGWKESQYTFPTYQTFANSLFYSSMSSTVYEDQKTQAIALKGDMTWQVDRANLLKGGFEVKQNDLDYYYVANPVNPADQTRNVYRKKPVEASAYLQDKVEFETIVLNLGVRLDLFDPSTSFRSDPFNPASSGGTTMKSVVSPRLGIAYPVRDNMVFHFTYGQFFQRPEYQALYDNLDRTFSNRRTLFGTPNLQPEQTTSYELGLMTSFDAGASLQMTFFSKKIQNLIGIAWNYTPLPYAYYVNEDFATVKGFEIAAKGRWGPLTAGVNYTFSVAKGSSSSQQQRYSGSFNIVGVQSLRFLPLDFDQRHTANGQVAVFFRDDEGPFGLLPEVFGNSTCNLIARYGSGLPYTFNPARAIYVAERNNSRLPARFNLDLYARKGFRLGALELGVFADIRNLMDRKNIVSVYSTTGSPDVTGDETFKATPDYMQDPTNYATPRTIYLGIDIGL